jgi:hypothetical protein
MVSKVFREWNQMFHEFLFSFNLEKRDTDLCLYILFFTVLLLLYSRWFGSWKAWFISLWNGGILWSHSIREFFVRLQIQKTETRSWFVFVRRPIPIISIFCWQSMECLLDQGSGRPTASKTRFPISFCTDCITVLTLKILNSIISLLEGWFAIFSLMVWLKCFKTQSIHADIQCRTCMFGALITVRLSSQKIMLVVAMSDRSAWFFGSKYSCSYSYIYIYSILYIRKRVITLNQMT